jgi:hypothetical protein
MAGVMLSFGGLISEILQGGATGLTASNPGIVKILGGFVFPVGLVMFAFFLSQSLHKHSQLFLKDCVTRTRAAHEQYDGKIVLLYSSIKRADYRTCRHFPWPLLNVLFHRGVSL